MSEINYVVGDATKPQGRGVKIIAHVCNDKGGWGRGFVTALSQKSRIPEESYRRWFKDQVWECDSFGLGQIQVVSFGRTGVLVANMIAQHGIRHDAKAPVALDYPALRECLDNLGKEAGHLATGDSVPSIHMPRIGCGLGGGRWELVEEAILESLVDVYGLDVTVYSLPGEVWD